MKTLIAIIVFLNGCATPHDRLAEELPKHIEMCQCEMSHRSSHSYDVDWKDKGSISKHVHRCKCVFHIENEDFDLVQDFREYVKPGSTFIAPTALYPWDMSEEERKENIKQQTMQKVD